MSATKPVETLHEVAGAADRLGCKAGSIYKLVASGELKSVRVGRLIRIPESAVADFIASGGSIRRNR